MQTERLRYTPSPELVKRVRFFFVRTLWHEELTQAMVLHARERLAELSFPSEKVHELVVAGAFELLHAAGAIVRRYAWKRGFTQLVAIQGPTQIQSNLRLPPFFQGNFDSKLRSQFLLESPGPIGYLQPYEPGAEGELPVVLTLGCILRGATEHNRYLATAVIQQLAQLNLSAGVPIILGVLTPDTLKQAWERVSQAGDWVLSGFAAWEARLAIAALPIGASPTESPRSDPSLPGAS